MYNVNYPPMIGHESRIYSWDYYSIKNRVTKENFTKFESEFREWNVKENNLALFHETLTIEYLLMRGEYRGFLVSNSIETSTSRGLREA